MITGINLSSERKQELEAMMIEANSIIKDLHSRAKLFKGEKHNRSYFRGELFRLMGDGDKDINVCGVFVPSRLLKPIAAMRKVEMEIIQGYIAVVGKSVRNWSKICKGPIDADDIYSESLVALIDAIYYYLDKKTSFITYLVHVINGRLNRLRMESQDIRLPIDVNKLVKKYNKARNSMGGCATFAEVVDHMNLSKKEISLLEKGLRKVYVSSDLSQESPRMVDYINMLPSKETGTTEPDELMAIQHVKSTLNDMELAIFEGYMVGTPGWQIRMSKELGITRQRVSQIFLKTIPKIMDSIRRQIVEAA